MKTQRIAGTSLDVSRIALGCMRLSDDRKEALASIRAALDQGINFFDHADVYGRGQREEVFSAIWQDSPGLRQRIILQTKCGIRLAGDPDERSVKRYDFSYENIIRAVNGSLKRLKTDYVDILLLHRPDALVEPEEVAKAFTELQNAGKVRFFGVSNHTGAQIDLLRTVVTQPLVVNQVQLSILHSHLINAGIITNQHNPPSPVRGDGTLEYCRTHQITVQAWSPLARGAITGNLPPGAEERVVRTAQLVAEMAREKNVSREAIVIAWLLRHPAKIQVIIGTTNPERIKACCEADNVVLSREEWYRLFITGRGYDLP